MRLGTFTDHISLKRAEFVVGLLRDAGRDVEIVPFEHPDSEANSEGVITSPLDRALLSGDIQLAVYALKELPPELPDGLILAAIPLREDPSDAFVARAGSGISSMSDLPQGATVAAPSARQRAFLKAWRSDLNVVPAGRDADEQLRNLDESNPQQGGWHGLVLATAKLARIDMQHRITEKISPDILLPAAGQGALGIVTTEKNREWIASTLNDNASAITTTVERAVLQRLGSGQGVTVGVWAQLVGDFVKVSAAVSSPDGSKTLREAFAGPADQSAHLGESLADRLLALGAEALLRGEDIPQQAPEV